MAGDLNPEFTGVPRGGVPMHAVVIGASAGGPGAIERILAGLPAGFPVPVAVCQHTMEGRTGPWARRLDESCAVAVCEAEHNQLFERGRVHIAPAGRHMRLRSTPGGVRITLAEDFADSLFVPSIDYLMSSAASVYGSRLLAVLLTGMCTDGALGMLGVHRAGGLTIAQTEESSAFSSMPRAAADLGAVAESVSVERMAEVIMERVSGRG
jgi:two-component system chemotaxis response regulator CheB